MFFRRLLGYSIFFAFGTDNQATISPGGRGTETRGGRVYLVAIRRGAIIAFAAGLAFPLLGTAIEAAHHDALTLGALWQAQSATPLLWILNVVPLVLGFAGHLVEGTFRDAVVPISREGRRLTQHLVLLALVSALLLMYALQQFADATRMTQDVNLAGSLRAETVTAYQVAAHPGKSAGVTVYGQIERIDNARARLRARVPDFFADTDQEWRTVRAALLKPGGANWAATERLGAAADVLAANIEVEATRRNNQASVVLALGIFSLAVALLKGFDLARQLQEAEAALRLSQTRLAEAQRVARLGSWEYNPASQMLLWSDEVFRIFGVPQAHGRMTFSYPDFLASLHEDDRKRLEDAFVGALHGGGADVAFALDHRVRLAQGAIRYVHTTGHAARDTRTGAMRLVGTIQDVTERKRDEQELQAANALLHQLATTDGLTGLHNHRLFHERLESETARATRYNVPLSLVMLDVDYFKAFNDTYGHPAGDEILKEIAARIGALARASDVVARYGGEEFAILLPDTDREGAYAFAERCRAAIEAGPWPVAKTTASLGVATLISPATSHTSLLSAADKALYRSKREGRNRVTEALPQMSINGAPHAKVPLPPPSK